MGQRRRGREHALQVLYALDAQASFDASVDAQAVVEELARFWQSFEGKAEADIVEFCEALVWGVVQNLETLDTMIRAASKNWRMERMSRVDRNLLRLACCELRVVKEVPINVVFNEAIELAKRFGAAESAAFVNGLLDKIVRAETEGEGPVGSAEGSDGENRENHGRDEGDSGPLEASPA